MRARSKLPVRRYRGRWTPRDSEEAVYRYLPFEVPADTAGVTVRYAFEAGPDAVLDLGVLDSDGFRGWSGADRREVVITPRRATPGYLPGPLPAGEWQVLLGLYRVPPQGLGFEVDIELGPAEPEAPPPPPRRPERPPRRDLPARAGHHWFAGDLHNHTVHSDGVLTPAALACLGAERGLDFLAVTDHNVVSHHPELPAAGAHAGILLLPGQEATTYEGHANALGALEWVDFRRSTDDWLVAVERGGGLLSINHPLAGESAWRRPVSRRPPLTEVWHWTWDRCNDAPLRWWASWGGVPVGGSDFHWHGHGGLPGQPTTWIEAEELSMPGLLDALRQGRTAISAEPTGPAAVRHEDAIVVVDGEGTTLLGPAGDIWSVKSSIERIRSRPGLHRLVDPSGVTLALVP